MKHRKNEELSPELYQKLRRMARRYFRSERRNHTLAPTALVHEAYLRLCREPSASSDPRIPLAATMARLMRECLINHAKAKRRLKRGAGAIQVTLNDERMGAGEAADAPLDLLLLDESLAELARVEPELAKLVEIKFFLGLTIPETAKILETSPATVKRDWAFAKAWLQNAIKKNKEAA